MFDRTADDAKSQVVDLDAAAGRSHRVRRSAAGGKSPLGDARSRTGCRISSRPTSPLWRLSAAVTAVVPALREPLAWLRSAIEIVSFAAPSSLATAAFLGILAAAVRRRMRPAWWFLVIYVVFGRLLNWITRVASRPSTENGMVTRAVLSCRADTWDQAEGPAIVDPGICRLTALTEGRTSGLLQSLGG